MTNPPPSARFQSSAWLIPVAVLVFLAFLAQSFHRSRLAQTTSLRTTATLLCLVLAVALTQQFIRARSAYSTAFSTVIALFLVAIIAVAEFLLLTLFAVIFMPSSLV